MRMMHDPRGPPPPISPHEQPPPRRSDSRGSNRGPLPTDGGGRYSAGGDRPPYPDSSRPYPDSSRAPPFSDAAAVVAAAVARSSASGDMRSHPTLTSQQVGFHCYCKVYQWHSPDLRKFICFACK